MLICRVLKLQSLKLFNLRIRWVPKLQISIF